ncbi:MAG: SulP family inorganic anion transporter [Bacteroidia bacterium]
MPNTQGIPKWNNRSALKSIRLDLASGFGVALVALPLSLGISFASGTPPLSGLIAAIVGGLLVSFISGTAVGVKGPAAGLIVVTIGAMEYYSQFSDNMLDTYKYVLPIFIISGVLMTLIGVFRLGKIADFFPAAVVKGMLAAIGLIILTKQLGVAFLGEKGPFSDSMDILQNLEYYVLNLNPIVAIITVNCLLLLIFLPKVKNKIINILPPPMWVMVVSIPFVFFFDFNHEREVQLIGESHLISEALLVNIPENLKEGLLFPNFKFIATANFWLFVLSVTLVSTIENLASAKAIENLDVHKRKTLMNRDMISSGIATIISGFIGGLPSITVIARSSVNVTQGAQTRWANFYHGLLVFLFIFFFGKYVEFVPLAALASILIFTGYKLTSPKVFKDAYLRGGEQFVIIAGTLISILEAGLIWGIFIGIALTLIIHLLRSGISTRLFLKYLTRPGIKVINEGDDFIVKIKGIANFFNILIIKKIIDELPQKKHVMLEFSTARLVDYTVLEFVYKRSFEYNEQGGNMELLGLDVHQSSSHHPWSLHINRPKRKLRLNKRQKDLQLYAYKNGWTFAPRRNWQTAFVEKYRFFSGRPVEFEKNIINGRYEDLDVSFHISDITFDEGALLATEVYHTTVQIIDLPFSIPVFSLEKEQFADRVLELAGFHDIDFEKHDKFSKNFLLHGEDKHAVSKFFSKSLRQFFVQHEVYHVESNGSSIMLFKFFRLASFENLGKMVAFGHDLSKELLRNTTNA